MAESAGWWLETRSGTMVWVRFTRSLRRLNFSFPSLEVKEAGEHSAHLLPERNTKVLGAKEDLVLKGVVSHSPAIAWELRGTRGVAMEVNPKVGVADA
jgi:hypothetical protein